MNESLNQLIRLISSKLWIPSETNKWLFMSESLNHSFIGLVQNCEYLQQQNKWLFISESLNDSFVGLVQNCESLQKLNKWLFMNESTESLIRLISSKLWIPSETKQVTLYEWVTESFIHRIVQNCEFLQKLNKWLFMSESLNHSLSD